MATVNINLTDVNDNSPAFSQDVYTAVVSEDAELGKTVIVVRTFFFFFFLYATNDTTACGVICHMAVITFTSAVSFHSPSHSVLHVWIMYRVCAPVLNHHLAARRNEDQCSSCSPHLSSRALCDTHVHVVLIKRRLTYYGPIFDETFFSPFVCKPPPTPTPHLFLCSSAPSVSPHKSSFTCFLQRAWMEFLIKLDACHCLIPLNPHCLLISQGSAFSLCQLKTVIPTGGWRRHLQTNVSVCLFFRQEQSCGEAVL